MIADGLSGDIQEHAYWGSMRDRLPRSHLESLTPSGSVTAERDGPRVRVFANENLCLIRSGQDWTDTSGDERTMYLNNVEPVLRAAIRSTNPMA